ncbi:UNVERIFIED_CONTAM: hypothetical protein NCL1_22723 [Trichonephila clavipes]
MNLHVLLPYSDGLKNFVEVTHNFLQDEEYTGRPRLAVIPKNVFAIRKILMDDNRCTYQMRQKEHNIGSAAIHKIIHEELRMKKVIFAFEFPIILLSTQKRSVSESVKRLLHC